MAALFSMSSCCNSDCFDDLTGSVELKLHFDSLDTVKSFDPTQLELLDSVYIIKTVKGEINNHIDTIYHFDKQYFNRTNLFILNNDKGFDYIYGNRDPYFRVEITDFLSEISEGKGKCNCDKTDRLGVTINGDRKLGTAIGPFWVFKN